MTPAVCKRYCLCLVIANLNQHIFRALQTFLRDLSQVSETGCILVLYIFQCRKRSFCLLGHLCLLQFITGLQFELFYVSLPWDQGHWVTVCLILDILDSSLLLSKNGIGAEGISTNLSAHGKRAFDGAVDVCTYLVLSKGATANLPTTPSFGGTCRITIFGISGMILCTLIDSFMAVQSFVASRRFMRHFDCGFREASLITWSPVPGSTKHVVLYSADFITLMQFQTLYVRLSRKASSFGIASNSISRPMRRQLWINVSNFNYTWA